MVGARGLGETAHGSRCAYCGVSLTRATAPLAEDADDRAGRSAPAVGADDELRPVTALFADVVGSTGLGERLAPEEVKALIGECVSRMARAVELYGGRSSRTWATASQRSSAAGSSGAASGGF